MKRTKHLVRTKLGNCSGCRSEVCFATSVCVELLNGNIPARFNPTTVYDFSLVFQEAAFPIQRVATKSRRTLVNNSTWFSNGRIRKAVD